jgi:hypothetical protein
VEIEVFPAESRGTAESQREPAEPDRRNVARRRLLGVGLGGAAAALLPAIAGRAGATTPPNTGNPGGTNAPVDTLSVTTTAPAPSTAAATTTTAPPKRPTDADVPLLKFAQDVELAAYQLYEIGLATKLDDVQHTVLQVITQAHLAYANALSGLLGRLADNKVDQALLSSKSAAFGGDLQTMLTAAGSLESTLVATHVSIIGQLIGTDAAYLLASIVTVEARYGTVLASIQGATALPDLLVDKEAAALTPAGG